MLLHVSILRSSSGSTYCSLLKLHVKVNKSLYLSVMWQHVVSLCMRCFNVLNFRLIYNIQFVHSLVCNTQRSIYHIYDVHVTVTSLMYSFKYNQQDATLYSILYYCQCSSCFRRFRRPSSGTQNCIHSIRYMSSLTYTRCCGYSFELLMMGGETA